MLVHRYKRSRKAAEPDLSPVSSTSPDTARRPTMVHSPLEDEIIVEDFGDDFTLVDEVLTVATISFLGFLSKFIMQVLNSTDIENAENLNDYLYNRKENQGLITVSNHVSAVDDPGVIAAIIPSSLFFDARAIRWTMCATDRCFKKKYLHGFFRKGKVLPIERGGGLYQEGMTTVIRKLNRGEWIHMFPGGSRLPDCSIGKVRHGVARLIAEPTVTPVVVPIYHYGMQNVMQKGGYNFVTYGQDLQIIIGAPLDFSDLISKRRGDEIQSDEELFTLISLRIEKTLEELKLAGDEKLKRRLEQKKARASSRTSLAR